VNRQALISTAACAPVCGETSRQLQGVTAFEIWLMTQDSLSTWWWLWQHRGSEWWREWTEFVCAKNLTPCASGSAIYTIRARGSLRVQGVAQRPFQGELSRKVPFITNLFPGLTF